MAKKWQSDWEDEPAQEFEYWAVGPGSLEDGCLECTADECILMGGSYCPAGYSPTADPTKETMSIEERNKKFAADHRKKIARTLRENNVEHMLPLTISELEKLVPFGKHAILNWINKKWLKTKRRKVRQNRIHVITNINWEALE